jgi:UDP-N-acetylmuramoyl-tripeptide--D-alanyl-D-alanine ligase
MVELRLDTIAAKMEGTIVQGRPSQTFRAFSIDSRLISKGGFFFALHCLRDGHDFLRDAVERGASGAVVSKDISGMDKSVSIIRVPDTFQALQLLARRVLEDFPIKIIGITGSIGKTTTKEFTYELLKKEFHLLKSEGNFNNHLGLPLSLLKLTPSHEIAVLEMGMSHKGEIAALTQIAPPDVAVITNIKPVHLEFFDSIENIAQAKSEILEGTKSEGTAVLNGDDPLIQNIVSRWKGKTIRFGRSESADVRALSIRRNGQNRISFTLGYGKETADLQLPFVYDSHLDNYLAAAAVAYALAVPLSSIAAQTETLRPLKMRGELHRLPKGLHLLDDSYNSSPAALENALHSLAHFPGKRKVAVLGDMLELGPKEHEFHKEAGKAAARNGWDVLVTVGPRSLAMEEGAREGGMKRENILSFENSEDAAARMADFVKEGDLVLVKGSRGMKMEHVVQVLLRKER